MSRPWPSHLPLPDSWKPNSLTPADIDLCCEYANLFDLLAPHYLRFQKLKACMDAECDSRTVPEGDDITLDGERWRLNISPRDFKRRITDKEKLKRKLAALGAFAESWEVPFKLIDEYIAEHQQATFLVKERKGPRRHTRARRDVHLKLDTVTTDALAAVGITVSQPAESKESPDDGN